LNENLCASIQSTFKDYHPDVIAKAPSMLAYRSNSSTRVTYFCVIKTGVHEEI
jgi:hypothetical protein